MSHMNLSRYVGQYLVECSLLRAVRQYRVRVRIRVRIGFSAWLVSCNAHVFVRVSVVIVKDPVLVTSATLSSACIGYGTMTTESGTNTSAYPLINQTLNNNANHNRNPTTKQHAVVRIQLNIVTCPTYSEKFIRDRVVPFVKNSRRHFILGPLTRILPMYQIKAHFANHLL